MSVLKSIWLFFYIFSVLLLQTEGAATCSDQANLQANVPICQASVCNSVTQSTVIINNLYTWNCCGKAVSCCTTSVTSSNSWVATSCGASFPANQYTEMWFNYQFSLPNTCPNTYSLAFPGTSQPLSTYSPSNPATVTISANYLGLDAQPTAGPAYSAISVSQAGLFCQLSGIQYWYGVTIPMPTASPTASPSNPSVAPSVRPTEISRSPVIIASRAPTLAPVDDVEDDDAQAHSSGGSGGGLSSTDATIVGVVCGVVGGIALVVLLVYVVHKYRTPPRNDEIPMVNTTPSDAL